MNKFYLSAILSCMVLLASANEYVFDLREIEIPTTGNTLVMTSDDGEITFTITIPETDVADYGTPQRMPADPADLENFVLDVDYHAVLYIHDTVEDLYYPVSSQIIPITWDLSSQEVITGVKSIDADNRTVAGVEFYNVAGQRMASPNGLTIVVTRFTDGSVMSTKQIFK